MWFWIFVAVAAGLFSIICIAVVVVGVVRAKKNPQKEKAQSVKTPAEHQLAISDKTLGVEKQITSHMVQLTNQLQSINSKIQKISAQTHETLMKYIETVDKKSSDSDFAELLSIYARRQNSVNDAYLTVLRKCKEKNLTETKKLCAWEEKRKS